MDSQNSKKPVYTGEGQFMRPPASETNIPIKTPEQDYAVAPKDEYDGYGALPSCAPLASPYVPFQSENPAQYLPSKGAVRGTLFPGLDLPFKAMVNGGEMWGTPMAELMALDFAIKELQLYLDTHPQDTEVFDLLKSYISLQDDGMKRYIADYGPITVDQLSEASSYTWINSPWPWEYSKEGK